MTAPADCRSRRDRELVQALRRWHRGLRDGTIPIQRFRDFYREAVDRLGEERGKAAAEILWPDRLGPMPPPAPVAGKEAPPC